MAQIDFGAIQPLMDDETIFRITVNSPQNIHISGRDIWLDRSDIEFADEAAVDALAERIAAAAHMPLDYQHPIIDVRLSDGGRALLISRYVSSQGTVIYIEKAHNHELTIDRIVEVKAISQEAADFLLACIPAHRKVAFVGGYFSGRQAVLNAFAQYIPEIASTVVIEPFSAIHLPKHKNLVKLETQQSSFMDSANLNNNALLDAALRLRPHRLIVAEIDGSEMSGLLNAMYNGLDVFFSMSAVNSADALARIEMMAIAGNLSRPIMAIREQIANSLDVIVHVDLMHDALQRIIAISVIEGMKGDSVNIRDIFVREQGLGGGDLIQIADIPQTIIKS